MFAGKFKFDINENYDPENGIVPRSNFDEVF